MTSGRTVYKRHMMIITLLFWTCICQMVHSESQSAEQFKPDKVLIRKFVQMPYPAVIVELDKMTHKLQYEYGLVLASVQLFGLNNTKNAMKYCEYAAKVSQKHGYSNGRVFFLEGYIHSSLNNNAETVTALKMASDCFRKEKDLESLKSSLSFLGTECYRYGKFEQSRQAYEELLTLCTETEDEQTKVQTLFDIGEVYYRLSKIPQAQKAAGEAQAIYLKADNQNGLANCLKLLGNISSAEGDDDKAGNYYLQAFEAYEKTNDFHGRGNCQFNLGLLSIGSKRYAEAQEHLKKAIYFYTESGSVEGTGIAQMELGRTYLLQKEHMKAELALKQAESFLTGHSIFRLAQTKDYLGDLEKARNNTKQALLYYEASAELYRQIDLRKNVTKIKKKIEAIKNMDD